MREFVLVVFLVQSSFLVSSCKSKEKADNSTIIAISNKTSKLKSQSVVWLNGEPVSWLSSDNGFARYFGGYPFKKGTNKINVKPLFRVGDPVFDAEILDAEIVVDRKPVEYDVKTSESDFLVTFTLPREYSKPLSLRRGEMTESNIRKCEQFSVNLANTLTNNDYENFLKLFDNQEENIKNRMRLTQFFENKYKLVKAVSVLEDVESAVGISMSVVYPVVNIENKGEIPVSSQKLITLKIGETAHTYIRSLSFFVDIDNDIYVRTPLNDWLKLGNN